jgi:hypothetical protein
MTKQVPVSRPPSAAQGKLRERFPEVNHNRNRNSNGLHDRQKQPMMDNEKLNPSTIRASVRSLAKKKIVR